MQSSKTKAADWEVKVAIKIKAEGGGAPTASVQHLSSHNTSALNQCAIILAALKSGQKTTIELRYEYGVMAPAARIDKLRKSHEIKTSYVSVRTPDGVLHRRVAKYCLLPGESV